MFTQTDKKDWIGIVRIKDVFGMPCGFVVVFKLLFGFESISLFENSLKLLKLFHLCIQQ